MLSDGEIGSDNKKDHIAVHVLLTSFFFSAKIRLYFEITGICVDSTVMGFLKPFR